MNVSLHSPEKTGGEAVIIDGKTIAANLRRRIAQEVALLKERYHITPGLAVVLVGDNPASEVYVHNKVIQTREVGMNSFEFRMPADTTQKNLISRIEHLNNDPKVHAILVQLPLPSHIDEKLVIDTIHPDKDVDGFHTENVGRLVIGMEGMVPCTPVGCLALIKEQFGGNISGKKALVIGRSNIVGKPMMHLLLQANCTVTVAHSKTQDIAAECKSADIVIAAVGIPEFVKGEWLKPGAVVIDVGINRIPLESGKTKLVGDVDFASAKKVAGAITPVPGGVGPMTIACLLQNTLVATCLQKGLPTPEF